MASNCSLEPIHVGLVASEPIRLQGFRSVFEQETPENKPPLLPVVGQIEDLLAHPALQFMVIDLHAVSCGLEMLESIRRIRPAIRLIVIGPIGNEGLIMEAIVAGARAYLDHTAGPEVVRKAIEEVVAGSLWLSRQLLSKLIDRLLAVPDCNLSRPAPHFTVRERQVLELIQKASSNREIARKLGIEERTVKSHVSHLMSKTGADNRIDLSLLTMDRPMPPQFTSKRGGRAGTSRRLRDS